MNKVIDPHLCRNRGLQKGSRLNRRRSRRDHGPSYAEKLATVGRLAATIAHEINNPLEAVTNVLYLISRNPKLDAALRQYVTIAIPALRTRLDIIRSLPHLEFRRMGRLTVRTTWLEG